MPRHRHDGSFAALVLAGSYTEAGDTGWHTVEPGDVIIHRTHESHLDRFGARGAEVLVLPLPDGWCGATHGRVADADLIARLAHQDPRDAVHALMNTVVPCIAPDRDWPGLLADALIADPDLKLARWAITQGLHPGTLGRGFRQQFGVTPAHFRSNVRLHRALRALNHQDAMLGDIAATAGFADQAHMSRTFRRLIGLTPAATARQSVRSNK